VSRGLGDVYKRQLINRFTIRLSNPTKIFQKLPDIYRKFKLPEKDKIQAFNYLLKHFINSNWAKYVNDIQKTTNMSKIIVFCGQEDTLFSKYLANQWNNFSLTETIVIKNMNHDINSNYKDLLNHIKKHI